MISSLLLGVLLFSGEANDLIAAPHTGDGVAWSYAWAIDPNPLEPNAPGRSTITFSGDNFGTVNSSTYSLDLEYRTKSTALSPESLMHVPFRLSVTLLDQMSGIPGSVQFNGHLDGEVQAGKALLHTSFEGPTNRLLNLDSRIYTVSVDVPPGPREGDVATAGLTSGVAATVRFQISTVLGVPEPSTLGLSAVAILVAGLVRFGRLFGRRHT